VHQDYIACRGGILDDLERYPIDFFDTFVKPRYPRFWIACGAQISEVGVPFERLTELWAPRPRQRWILRKPPMQKAM
jgi:hypothetical protein